MRYAHILSRVTGSPWLITQDALNSITGLLEARMNNIRADVETTAAVPPVPVTVKTGPTIAVIPVHGILAPRLSLMEALCGGCDTEIIKQLFNAANADSAIQAIVMHFDSPGGLAMGCHELFTHLYGAKAKPLYAFTDGMLCSAAYYLAAACDSITCTPTAQIGSIGTILIVRQDGNKDGSKLHVFKSGEFKDLGSPARTPTEKEATVLQSRVDYIGAMFRGDMLKARPSIPADAMEGLAYFGRESVRLHLADNCVNDFETFLSGLT